MTWGDLVVVLAAGVLVGLLMASIFGVLALFAMYADSRHERKMLARENEKADRERAGGGDPGDRDSEAQHPDSEPAAEDPGSSEGS